jgi:uncharacterized protein YndB with AHSA1/START domain
MNEYQIVRDIECSPEDVFAALTNLDKVPDWNSSVVEVRWNNAVPLTVGSTVVYLGKFLGRVFQSDAQVTEFIPGSKYSSKSTSGPFYLEVENVLESIDGGTRVTSNFRGESRGFFKLAEPVIVRLSKTLFETSTDNLKALLEAHSI